MAAESGIVQAVVDAERIPPRPELFIGIWYNHAAGEWFCGGAYPSPGLVKGCALTPPLTIARVPGESYGRTDGVGLAALCNAIRRIQESTVDRLLPANVSAAVADAMALLPLVAPRVGGGK